MTNLDYLLQSALFGTFLANLLERVLAKDAEGGELSSIEQLERHIVQDLAELGRMYRQRRCLADIRRLEREIAEKKRELEPRLLIKP